MSSETFLSRFSDKLLKCMSEWNHLNLCWSTFFVFWELFGHKSLELLLYFSIVIWKYEPNFKLHILNDGMISVSLYHSKRKALVPLWVYYCTFWKLLCFHKSIEIISTNFCSWRNIISHWTCEFQFFFNFTQCFSDWEILKFDSGSKCKVVHLLVLRMAAVVPA